MLTLMMALTMPTAAALEPGPYVVGQRDVQFTDDDAGTVWATIHYPALAGGEDTPADLSGGPYPLVAFLHGWLGSAWMYAEVCDHMASLGLVVVNMDTETHPFLDMERFAVDTVAALHWVDDRSMAPGHWLAGTVSGDDWTATGHSMGGATLARLIDHEPRISTLIGFMPYQSDVDDDYVAMSSFEGSALYLAGTEDDSSTSAMVADWHAQMQGTARGLLMDIEGAGHQAVSTFEWQGETMPDVEQREVVATLAEDFLTAEVLGDPAGHRELLFDRPATMATLSSRSHSPVSVLQAAGDDALDVGLISTPDAELVLFAGEGPGETVMGDLGPVGLEGAVEVLRTSLPDGLDGTRVPADGDLARSWFQVGSLADGELVLGPPTDVFGVGLPVPDAEDPDGEAGPDGATDPDAPGPDGEPAPSVDAGPLVAAGAGCAVTPSAPSRSAALGWLVLGGLLGLRRRGSAGRG